MKTGKTLFLLSKTYPYEDGEQYITNELPYLAKVFDKIIIYPNDYYGNATEHNKHLPENVEVFNFNQQLNQKSINTISDYWYLIKQTILELIETDDKKHFFKNFKWNLINFWTQYQISKLLAVYLKANDFNDTNTVFYSYWFHKSAILLSILKDKKQINHFVSRAHSIDLYHHKWGIINNEVKVPPFKMFKLKHIDSILTVSKQGERFLKKNYSRYEHKINTDYLGVIDDKIEKTKIIDELNFHIVTCSHIDENKRLTELAKALKNLKHKVRWIHFGTGNHVDDLLDITSSFPSNIVFDFKGAVPNSEVKKYYAKHDVNLFVNLSIVEGIPVSIMEAAMYCIPILATEIYGVPEVVINNVNGGLLPVDFTQQQLIDKLNFCIENKELLKKMGKQSHSIYSEKFSAEKNYTEFANYLKSLLK